MSIDEKQYETMIYQTFNDLLTHKKYDVMDKLYSEDASLWYVKEKLVGRDAMKKSIIERCNAIPDIHYFIDNIIIKGNHAAIRWHAKGKVIKDFAGFKAGHPADYWGISFFEVNDQGLIHKVWAPSTTLDQ